MKFDGRTIHTTPLSQTISASFAAVVAVLVAKRPRNPNFRHARELPFRMLGLAVSRAAHGTVHVLVEVPQAYPVYGTCGGMPRIAGCG